MFGRLFAFLWKNGPSGMTVPVLVLALVTGLSRDGMLFVTIAAASAAEEPTLLTLWLPAFVATLLATSLLQLWYPVYAREMVARMATSLRLRLIGKLLQESPVLLQTRGHGSIYHIMTTDVEVATFIARKLFELLPAVIFLAVAAPQVVILSPLAGVFAVVVMIGGILGYYLQQRAMSRIADDLRSQEVAYFERVSDVVGGLRELKLHGPRRRDFFAEVAGNVEAMGRLQVSKERRYAAGEAVVQALKYGLLGGIVFLVPFIDHGSGKTVFQLLTVILFSLGPFETLIGNYPEFVSAAISLRRIEELDARLGGDGTIDAAPVAPPRPFRTLAFEGVSADYSATADSDFRLGPIDFELHRGEVVFLVGDNGSGKTTFLNVLTGLLGISGGRMLIDGHPLEPADMVGYRDRFSAIFTVFHLFYRLFGLTRTDPARANAVLERLDLGGLTSCADGRFTRLDLSSGQRRRLALAVVLLEDREIVVLDEFVADQDPGKREYFFKTLLPELKAAGKTVVVSTHDLAWAADCDRLIHFAGGRIDSIRWFRDGVEITPAAAETGSERHEARVGN